MNQEKWQHRWEAALNEDTPELFIQCVTDSEWVSVVQNNVLLPVSLRPLLKKTSPAWQKAVHMHIEPLIVLFGQSQNSFGRSGFWMDILEEMEQQKSKSLPMLDVFLQTSVPEKFGFLHRVFSTHLNPSAGLFSNLAFESLMERLAKTGWIKKNHCDGKPLLFLWHNPLFKEQWMHLPETLWNERLHDFSNVDLKFLQDFFSKGGESYEHNLVYLGWEKDPKPLIRWLCWILDHNPPLIQEVEKEWSTKSSLLFHHHAKYDGILVHAMKAAIATVEAKVLRASLEEVGTELLSKPKYRL